MKHITQVRVVGFQSHADTVISFGEGVNAITGPSDNGKSAVLRAIRWALWNQGPDGFVRDGCTLTQAEVTFSDGTIILRERNQKRNKYVVSRPGAESLALVDFGTKVPAEVLQAHGMRPVQFKPKKSSLLNFGGQLEPPFFLEDSPLERADILGRLAGVQVVDRAMDAADRDKRGLTSELKSLDEQATRMESELATYADLDERDRQVALAEEILRKIPFLTDSISRLHRLRQTWTDNLQGQDETGWTIDRLRTLEGAVLPLTEAENANLQVGPRVAIGSRWRQVTAGMTETARTLTRLAHADAAATAVKVADEAEILRRQLARLITQRDEVRKLWTPTKRVLAQTVGAQEALTQVNEAQAQQDRWERLQTLRSLRARVEAETIATAHALHTAESKLRAADTLQVVTSAQERLGVLQAHRARHQDTEAAIAKGRLYLSAVDDRIQAAAQEYGQALRETGICPTCLQVIHPETAAQIAAGMMTEEGHSHVS